MRAETARAASAAREATAASAVSVGTSASGTRRSCTRLGNLRMTRKLEIHQARAAHGVSLPPRCGQSGSVVRKDRIPRNGKCGTVLFCILDGVEDCVARVLRGRTGIYRRTCKRPLLRMVGRVQFCIDSSQVAGVRGR